MGSAGSVKVTKHLFLLSLHHRCRVNVRCLAYLPPEGTHGNDCHQQQGDDEDADTYRSLYHKVRRILVDKVIGKGNSYHNRASKYGLVFLEKQLVQVLHAGSVCLADSYFSVTATDVEERNAEQPQTTNQDTY